MKFVCLLFLTILLTNSFHGQNTSVNKNRKKTSVLKGVKIDSTKPSIYVDFVKIAEGESLNLDEPKERIYLKLVNNSKWSIYVSLFSYGETVEKTGIYYDVERTRDWLPFDEPIPQGYKTNGHFLRCCNELKSGKEVNFSIPRNHLADDLQIRINFIFDWVWDSYETDGKNKPNYPEISSSVYFTNSLLESLINSKK